MNKEFVIAYKKKNPLDWDCQIEYVRHIGICEKCHIVMNNIKKNIGSPRNLCQRGEVLFNTWKSKGTYIPLPSVWLKPYDAKAVWQGKKK
jgi:hypothetical protein